MSTRISLLARASAAALALLIGSTASIRAQSSAAAKAAQQTDSRWLGWLGCWKSAGDTAQKDQGKATCVVPIPGSRAVDMLTLSRGKIVSHDRLDAEGPPHAIDGQGCEGAESVNWSPTGRRVFLRSDYTCTGGTKGTSLAVNAISGTGEWLHVEEVRAGSGSVTTVDRRTPTALASVVSPAAATEIAQHQLAINTARASAAAPITTDEIVDAIQRLDAAVVKSWLASSGQKFDFTGEQLTRLAHADVPQTVLQTIMAAGMSAQPGTTLPPNHDVDEYLNRPVYQPGYANAAATYPMPSYPVQQYPVQQYPVPVCQAGMCVENPYSMYNGYNGYVGYPSYYPYPVYTPGYVFINPGRGGTFHGQGRGPTHEPPRPRPPQLPGPVGKRP